MTHPLLRRVSLLCAPLAVAAALVTASAFAKGTPSTVTITCGAGVQKATVTVQLVSGTTGPTPASNQVVLACSSAASTASTKISALKLPADAYTWQAFVTGSSTTFGCGGTTPRGTSATCTNAAGGAEAVTVLAT